MGQQILVSDQVIDLVADLAAFRPSQIFSSAEVGSHVEVQGPVDVRVRAQLRLALGRVGQLERMVVEVVADDVDNLSIDDMRRHESEL